MLFTHDARSRLLTVNEPGGVGPPAARMFFGRARTCNLWRFRSDLSGALVEGGRAVSVCRSVRITGAAHEAGVETLPGFRGRGYAKEVTALWARLVRSAGALPLYSTSWENAASRAVARKLRLTMYAADFHIT